MDNLPLPLEVHGLTKKFGNFTAVDHVSFTVQPGEAPADLGLRILAQVAGVRIADENKMVIIDQVIAGSRAAEMGLAPGDVLVMVNGAEVRTTSQANTEVSRGAERSSIVLSVARGRYVYNLTFPMGL